MRVLAAACRFLGRLLFLLGLSLRGRQPANRIFIVPDGAIQGVLSSGKHQPKRPQLHRAWPCWGLSSHGGSGQHGATPAGLSPNRPTKTLAACETANRNIICVGSTLCEFFDHRLGRSRAAREDLAFARKPFCIQSHRDSPGKPVPIPSAMANFEEGGRAKRF